MKKISTVFITMLLALTISTISSCKDIKREEIRQTIEEAQQDLPMDIGSGLEFSSLEYEEDEEVVVAEIYVDSKLMNIEALSGDYRLMKESLMVALNFNKDFLKIIKKIADADLAFIMRFTSSSDESIDIKIEAEEAKSFTRLKKKEAIDRYFKLQAKLVNKQTPMPIDAVTTMTRASVNGRYFIYEYAINEADLPFDHLKANLSQLKQGIITSLNDPNGAQAQFVKICREGHYGLKFVYIGDISGESVTVTLEPNSF